MSPILPINKKHYRSPAHAYVAACTYALITIVTLGDAYIFASRSQVAFSYKVAILFLLLVLASNLAAKVCISYACTLGRDSQYDV